MGHQIIRQPDGKLAVFSSGTDTWILVDVSAEELLDYYAERAAGDARRGTQLVLDSVLAGKPDEAYCQFAMSFDEANAMSAESGGVVWSDGWPEGHQMKPRDDPYLLVISLDRAYGGIEVSEVFRKPDADGWSQPPITTISIPFATQESAERARDGITSRVDSRAAVVQGSVVTDPRALPGS